MRFIRLSHACFAVGLLAASGLLLSVSAQDRSDFSAQADDLVEAYRDAGKLSGAVLVAHGDSILYQRAVGYADLSWRVPNATDTRFPIASITKQYTAALIHVLAEEGLVDLDATVVDVLSDYPVATGSEVTLTHLLTHTSGIPNFTRLPKWDDLMRDPAEPQAFMRFFWGLPLQFDPGSQFAYSNSNYVVLGVIVEHITGKPFMQVLYERLLAPLGLADTGYDGGRYVVERMARGYVPVSGGYAPESYMDPSFPYAAGMLYATTGDLFRWTRALHGGHVFQSPETLTHMLTPGRGERYGYAHGIGVYRNGFGQDSLTLVRHGGGIGGFYTEARYIPEHDWTIVGLDNARGDIGGLADDLVRLLLGQAVTPPTRLISRVLETTIEAEGLDAAVAQYHAILEAEAEAYELGEAELNRLGYTYLQRGAVAAAVRLFELNAEAYPESWNVHDSLGEGLATAGRWSEAIAAYERSLVLNPANEAGRQMLVRLREQ